MATIKLKFEWSLGSRLVICEPGLDDALGTASFISSSTKMDQSESFNGPLRRPKVSTFDD